jgi:hypothetical protein
VRIDLSDRIQMGSVINSGDFSPGQGIRFGSLDFITDLAGHLASATTFIEIQIFRFGSLDLITDRIGKLRFHDSVPCQSVETSLR